MAPFTLASAAFAVVHAQLDENSMLQMPIMADDECRCPGYYEDQCNAESAQGCVWSDAGSTNKPWCQCLGERQDVIINPVTLPPQPVTLPPQPVAPRFIRPSDGTAIYYEVDGVKYWVRSCAMCDDSTDPRPCNTYISVEQSYIDALQTGGGFPGAPDGTQFECNQHPQYVAPLPVVSMECTVEIQTSTAQHADTADGGSVEMLVDGVWSSPHEFAQNIAQGEVVLSDTETVPTRPTAIRISAGGGNAWGYSRVEVDCDGETILSLTSDETYSGSESDVRFWVDGNQNAPQTQEYQIPAHDAFQCTADAVTTTRQHGGTTTGATAQFLVHDVWSAPVSFGSSISDGQVVAATTWVSARPSSVRFSAGGSNAWGYSSLSITCAGENLLALEGDESYSGSESNLRFWVDGNQAAPESQDYTIPPLPEHQCDGLYEAEDATLNGPQEHANTASPGHQGFTGRSFADYINPTGDFIEWTVDSCSGGDATASFRYSLGGGNRPLQVLVNDEEAAASLSFPSTGGWNAWSSASVAVHLSPGMNVIRLVATGSSGANMDSLTIA